MSRAASVRARRIALLVAIAIAVVVIDVGSKVAIVSSMDDGDSKRLLGGAVYLSLLRNAGAAFGFAAGMTVIFAVVAVVGIIAIVRIAAKLRSRAWAVGLGLVLGGAVGNLNDRVFRSPGVLRGHVVDFISLFGPDGEHFPAFNAADSAITVGAVLLVITGLVGIGISGRPDSSAGQDSTSDKIEA